MAKKILIPYDGSDPAQRAIKYAAENYPDADCTALYVIEPRQDPDLYHIEQAREEQVERAHEVLEEVTVEFSDDAIETELKVGKPDHVIMEYSENNNFDLILMGSHGRSGISKVLLGSVAEKVLRNSELPVLVVR